MKICLYQISSIPIGTHNLKDPRLDKAHELVEAKKKVYAQVQLVGESDLANAEAVLVHSDWRSDLILKDMEMVENRLQRSPEPAEEAALKRLNEFLEKEMTVGEATLTAEDREALSAHSFTTNRPIITATEAELADPDPLLLKAYQQGGYICFLTVGGKENRAWSIRAGETAWEAASAVHSDIQKGFIRAEIIHYDDFVAEGGETGAKRAGKQTLETKTYVMQDYDVVNYRFNK